MAASPASDDLFALIATYPQQKARRQTAQKQAEIFGGVYIDKLVLQM